MSKNPTANAYAVTPRTAIQQIQLVLAGGRVPYLRGSPGIGKSAIVRKIAAMANLLIIDHRLSTSAPEDLSGLPRFDADGKARFSPFADLFPLEGQALPVNPATGRQYSGWLLFLDEFNSASKDVQAAAYKLILDRMVGQHRIHPDCYMVAAGNKDTDRAITNPMSTAMQSRVVHLFLEFNFKEWMEDVVVSQKWHPTVRAFLEQAGTAAAYDFNPSNQEATYCCPRTWEFMSDFMYQIEDLASAKEFTPTFAGTISANIAVQFVTFTGNFLNLPSFSEILKDPKNAPIPSSAGEQYAIISMASIRANKDEFDALMEYAMRFQVTFQLMFFRSSRLTYPDARRHKSFMDAAVKLDQYLHD
ncbi:ATPase [Delftia phage RG-2014]|uniref:ATPase dynein-related AAA domain-containing protein n=1 Tax=Delftia phage RG-2014 TaxID=1563661 RepID=A0A097PAJ8_9CAUD|nr:ATPase [Delftia phage RG-2014]AIU44287.1 hypothetical protein RG2014_033 [Delftia phage RG-2014]